MTGETKLSRMKVLKWVLVAVCLLSEAVSCAKLNLTVYNSTTHVSRLAVEEKPDGRLYVGCENNFLQLNSDLEEEKKLMIGPKYDTDECFATFGEATCNKGKSKVSNIVSTLAINKLHNYILMCGTIYQGLCSVHPLSDITSFQYLNEMDHASFVGSKESSVAFFGTPAKSVGDMSRRMLYAAVATYDRKTDKFSPRTISTREIVYNETTGSSIKYFLEDSVLRQYSYLTVDTTVQRNFRVNYVYGFELNGYGYYVSVQPFDIDISRTTYVTRLIQFCLDDTVYKTYVETVMKCSKGSFDYTIATSAYVQETESVDKLAVSFARAKTGTQGEIDPDFGSVVCMFDMSEVRKHFNNLQSYCSKSGVGSYPWWIYGSQQSCSISFTAVCSFSFFT